jgi:hypothetical protein
MFFYKKTASASKRRSHAERAAQIQFGSLQYDGQLLGDARTA